MNRKANAKKASIMLGFSLAAGSRWRLLEVLGVLGICITGQSGVLALLGHLDPERAALSSIRTGFPQHRVLREELVIELGHKIVLTVRIVAPNLAELDGFNGHRATAYQLPAASC